MALGQFLIAFVEANQISGNVVILAPANHTAIEFFSGIGAFAESVRSLQPSPSIEIVAAFDQKAECNAVYKHNFNLAPSAINLDSIKESRIPEADIWWMSPPCTPFSRRGHRRDAEDPRAASFLNLLKLMRLRKPRIVFIENVEGFLNSQVHELMERTFESLGMNLRHFNLCPTMFGIPMRRPRYFGIASHDNIFELSPEAQPIMPLSKFLVDDSEGNEALIVPDDVVSRYEPVLNVVDPSDEDAVLICFTSGYFRCHKASGSLLKTSNHRLRRVSPTEILALFGFSKEFEFPPELTLQQQWKLLGNSVETRCVKHILRLAGLNVTASEQRK